MPKPCNAVFFGSDPIGLPILEWGLGDSRLTWKGIFTQPDRARGRGKKVIPNAIKVFAEAHKIPVLQSSRPGPDMITWMSEHEIELGFVLAYGHILKQGHLDAPRLGMWNFHGSALPALRGASPIESALASGLDKTAMTLMRMVLKMDAGPILDQEWVEIERSDTSPILRTKMGEACLPLLDRQLDSIIEGEAQPEEQDHTAATYCRKLEKSDGVMDFSLPAVVLENRMRACIPWPGSGFLFEGQTIKVGKGSVIPGQIEASPGTVFIPENRSSIEIRCGSDSILCLELQRPGGKMLPAADFLRGFPLESGTKLDIVSSKIWEQASPFPHKPSVRPT